MRMFGIVLKWLGLAEMTVATLAFIVGLGLVIAQVVYRQVGSSLWWAQEWTQLLIMYAYFLGMSHIYQVRQMVVMDFVAEKLPFRPKVALYVATQMLVVVFCAIVLVAGLRNAPAELRFPSYVIQVPHFYWSLPLIIGAASMILTSIYFAIAVPLAARTGGQMPLRSLEQQSAFVSTRLEY